MSIVLGLNLITANDVQTNEQCPPLPPDWVKQQWPLGMFSGDESRDD